MGLSVLLKTTWQAIAYWYKELLVDCVFVSSLCKNFRVTHYSST
jgi:hypothetical protein